MRLSFTCFALFLLISVVTAQDYCHWTRWECSTSLGGWPSSGYDCLTTRARKCGPDCSTQCPLYSYYKEEFDSTEYKSRGFFCPATTTYTCAQFYPYYSKKKFPDPLWCPWTYWGSWDSSTLMCREDSGLSLANMSPVVYVRNRTRSCDCPSTRYGNFCPGSNHELQAKNAPGAACMWCSWGSWGSCSECAAGGYLTYMQKHRYRKCVCPGGNAEGNTCKGSSVDAMNCYSNPCAQTTTPGPNSDSHTSGYSVFHNPYHIMLFCAVMACAIGVLIFSLVAFFRRRAALNRRLRARTAAHTPVFPVTSMSSALSPGAYNVGFEADPSAPPAYFIAAPYAEDIPGPPPPMYGAWNQESPPSYEDVLKTPGVIIADQNSQSGSTE